MSTPPVVQQPHTPHLGLIQFLEPWQSNQPNGPSWFDWAISLLASIPRPAPVTHNHYSLTSSHNVTVNNTVIRNESRPKKKDSEIEIEGEKKSTIASWVLPVAAIVAIGAAVLVGVYGSELRKAEKALADTNLFRNAKTNNPSRFECQTDSGCTVCDSLGTDNTPASKRFNLDGKVAGIFLDIKNFQEKYLNQQKEYSDGLRALLVSAGAAATGALITAPWLVTAGAVAGLFSVVYLAHTLGTHWNDEQELSASTTKAIRDVIAELKHPTPAAKPAQQQPSQPIKDQPQLPSYAEACPEEDEKAKAEAEKEASRKAAAAAEAQKALEEELKKRQEDCKTPEEKAAVAQTMPLPSAPPKSADSLS
jgi:hypothetical protein